MKAKLKLFLPSFVAVIIIDQLTKWWAWTYFHPNGSEGAITPGSSHLFGTFRLVYAENPGAFLGMGDSLPPIISTAIFMYLIPLAVIGFSFYVIRSKEFMGRNVIIMGSVLAGGFSNVIDRYYNDAHVIDFLNVGIGSLRSGIFNVADMFVMFGVILIILFMYLDGEKLKKTQNET
ncbi:MAG: signal peptidase II [Saccharospirillaceae bacterium]|nr:signal peptidase II [Pseudomonadales bacterium]NRB80795.1 signal peptidase II [Saccharospirillaceae bacterium]